MKSTNGLCTLHDCLVSPCRQNTKRVKHTRYNKESMCGFNYYSGMYPECSLAAFPQNILHAHILCNCTDPNVPHIESFISN